MQRVQGLALLVALLLAAESAEAQAEAPQVEQARTEFEYGEEHYEAGRYGLAAQDFRRAFDLLSGVEHPRALMVLFNLGRTLERIPGREDEARTAYQRVIDESPRTPEFENTLGMATVGLRELDARVATSEHGGSSGGASISPVGPLVVTGVGGAALLVGVVVGAASLSMDAGFRGACDDLTMCPLRLRPQYDEMRAFSTAADVLLVVGGAIGILGLVLTFAITEDEQATTVSAACTMDGCLIVARGSF